MQRLFDKPFTLDRTVRLAIAALMSWGIVLLLNKLSGVLLPFVVALLLAYLLDPVVTWFQKRLRNKRWAALLITFFIILVLHAAFYAIVIPSVINEVEKFQEIFEANKEGVFTGRFIPEDLRERLKEFVHSEGFQEFFSFKSIGNMIRGALPEIWSSLGSLMGVLASLLGLIAIWLYLIFILMDYASFRDNWHRYVPHRVREQAVEFVTEFNTNFMGYFRQKTVIVIINIILFSIAFNIIGLPLATLLAFMVGLMNFIPYLQNLGVIPCLMSAGLLSLQTGQPFWIIMLIVLGVFIVIQVLEDAVMIPVFMKEVTGMNPALMLLAIAIWGSLLGILGMIIALPVSTLMITYYKKYVLQPGGTGENEK